VTILKTNNFFYKLVFKLVIIVNKNFLSQKLVVNVRFSCSDSIWWNL